MLTFLLNIFHLTLTFVPMLIYFIPYKYFKSSFKYLFLILVLTPVQWVLLDGKCIITIATKKTGGLKNKNFTEEYFSCLYIPIMNTLGIKNNKANWKKMIYTHLGINISLMWYYLFYKICDK